MLLVVTVTLDMQAAVVLVKMVLVKVAKAQEKIYLVLLAALELL